jgi:hypothetical protein
MITSLTAATLFTIAALHAMWGAGVTWPDRDSQALARRVAGFKGIKAMPPPAACLSVAAALTFAGLLVLDTGLFPSNVRLLTLVLLTIIFTFRGVIAYNSRWREMTSEEPFATLDRRLYGPLCLGIALGISLTILQNFGTTS